jgi:hypothetical protein
MIERLRVIKVGIINHSRVVCKQKIGKVKRKKIK